jgi:predicted nucleic acid-binding protein
MTLVDTTVWIDLFAGRNITQVSMSESLVVKKEDICLCGVILTEILQGIRNEKEYSKTESVLSNLLYLPMERSTFLLAAKIYRTLRSKGITIRNSVDCMIAAVCVENRITIMHNDKDFYLIAKEFDLKVLKV